MSALIESLAALKARETDAAAALQRAREAYTAACNRFREETTHEALGARREALVVFERAKVAYDEAHAAYWRAANPPAARRSS